MYEWEDKVKAIKETQDHLALERARDGEMEGMKSEVHFLDQRRKDLDRMTGELVTSLEEHAVGGASSSALLGHSRSAGRQFTSGSMQSRHPSWRRRGRRWRSL